MLSLLYVSVSTLSNATVLQEIESIVKRSVVHNASQGITGALIFAEGRFAQALEGQEARVEALMRDISRDSRHHEVKIVRREHITKSRFEPWSMAYSGTATYIGRSIEALFQPLGATQNAEIERVYALMEHLVAS